MFPGAVIRDANRGCLLGPDGVAWMMGGSPEAYHIHVINKVQVSCKEHWHSPDMMLSLT